MRQESNQIDLIPKHKNVSINYPDSFCELRKLLSSSDYRNDKITTLIRSRKISVIQQSRPPIQKRTMTSSQFLDLKFLPELKLKGKQVCIIDIIKFPQVSHSFPRFGFFQTLSMCANTCRVKPTLSSPELWTSQIHEPMNSTIV